MNRTDSSKRAGGTVIVSCTCNSAFQDTTYGVGRRVFNRCPEVAKRRYARCTVCGTEKEVRV